MKKTKISQDNVKPDPGFALGFIFLSPPFSPIRFFFCAMSQIFGHFTTQKKESDFLAFFAKKKSFVLILVDYSIHIDSITMG